MILLISNLRRTNLQISSGKWGRVFSIRRIEPERIRIARAWFTFLWSITSSQNQQEKMQTNDRTKEKLLDLIYWKDPVYSGVVFSIFNSVFFLLSVGGYSVLSLICYVVCFFLIVSSGFKFAKQALNYQKDPFK